MAEETWVWPAKPMICSPITPTKPLDSTSQLQSLFPANRDKLILHWNQEDTNKAGRKKKSSYTSSWQLPSGGAG